MKAVHWDELTAGMKAAWKDNNWAARRAGHWGALKVASTDHCSVGLTVPKMVVLKDEKMVGSMGG